MGRLGRDLRVVGQQLGRLEHGPAIGGHATGLDGRARLGPALEQAPGDQQDVGAGLQATVP